LLVDLRSDKTHFEAWLTKEKEPQYKLVVRTLGTADAVVETAQQIAWISAALRPSPNPLGIVTSEPTIRSICLENSRRVSSTSAQETPIAARCVISSNVGHVPLEPEGPLGQCWFDMFRNPVLVTGYPILQKHERNLGLEMPLNMMAKLVETKRAHSFNSKVFIKGSSAMLVAVKITRDMMLWHYVFNRLGQYIPYPNDEEYGTESVDLLQLDTVRHIVGWWPECVYLAGKLLNNCSRIN
jgi:hypothetical protein